MAILLPPLPVPGSEPAQSALGRWLRGGSDGGESHGAHPTFPWYKVIWLTGVDYFSTLGYQPGIALLAVGAISPLATLALVLVTLFGALPVYGAVARRSFQGQGSISMLERLLPGWKGKVFVLALIGFASTGFVITMTLSAADAAKHAVENPVLHPYLEGHELSLTLVLLANAYGLDLATPATALLLAAGGLQAGEPGSFLDEVGPLSGYTGTLVDDRQLGELQITESLGALRVSAPDLDRMAVNYGTQLSLYGEGYGSWTLAGFPYELFWVDQGTTRYLLSRNFSFVGSVPAGPPSE